jgi:Na+/H+ antiporter NhaC
MARTLLRLALALILSGLVALALPERGGKDGWSLFPPLAAILVAISTGRLILGLSIAILSGAALTLPAATPLYALPWFAIRHAALDFFWNPLVQSFQFYILGFTAALIGMVRVTSLAGGIQGVAALLAKRAAGARSTRIATFLLGLAIFFDDYANTLVVGTTMRPIADRFGVSREKLAYLVDSTAAPVAGIAVISTWIGYEVGLFDDVMRQVGGGISGYELFFLALPVRFYCILTLCFVALSTFLQRDFGPMLQAEQRALKQGQMLAPNAQPISGHHDQIQPPEGIRSHWGTAAAPVGLVIFSVLLGMHLDVWNLEQAVTARQQHTLFSRPYWTVVLSNANSAKVMFLASLAGSALAFLIALTRQDLASGRRLLGPWQIFKTWTGGITSFYYALIILVLAWAIKETCMAVGTSTYLIASLSDLLAPAILPVLVFLLAAVVAFSIGTSWTTMAILLPTMLPLSFEMGGLALVVLTAAAVLDGAIFGDHCSPISDTTVLSSIASSCDHIAHVRTQLPYALATMTAAATFGYLGTTLFYPSFIGLLLGLAGLTLLLFLLGRDPEKPVE